MVPGQLSEKQLIFNEFLFLRAKRLLLRVKSIFYFCFRFLLVTFFKLRVFFIFVADFYSFF